MAAKKKTQKETLLPDKPSELIRVALADLAKVERSKKYRVEMGTWHEPVDGVCEVCLAGAVMAKTLKSYPNETLWADTDFDDDTKNKLLALDFLRQGEVVEALEQLGFDDHEHIHDYDIVSYHTDRNEFKDDMRHLADDLEKVGL